MSSDDLSGFLSMARIERGPWRAFERSIARMFVHQGWPHVSLVGGAGDRGADVIASDGTQDVLVQVKFKSDADKPTGKTIVKDVERGMDFYDVDKGLGVTNTRLSPDANRYLENLNKTGYDIKKVEGRDLVDLYEQLPLWPGREYPPYDYQEEVIDTLTDMYFEGYGRGLLALATGLGKTFVAGKFIRNILEDDPTTQILILANQRALIKQFERSIWEHLPKTVSTHLWYGEEEPAYEDGIVIGTFQTIKNRVDQGDAGKYDLVVVDEAHHAPASTYRRVLDKLEPYFLLGLTATPWRDDGLSMTELFGHTREELTIDVIEALREGYLTEVDYRLYCDDLDWEQVQDHSHRNYNIKDLNKKLFVQERDDEILKEISRVWEEDDIERAIIYCASIQHAERMERQLRERGYSARCLQSDLDVKETERRLRKFRKGEISVITAVDMLNEGVDVPEVDLIVFLRVTHSRRIFLQQLGRGLRLAPDKEKVVVMDLVADIRRIAEAIDIESGVDKGVDVEVMDTNFSLTFNDQQAKSFFNEYLRDKAAISVKGNEEKVRFP